MGASALLASFPGELAPTLLDQQVRPFLLPSPPGLPGQASSLLSRRAAPRPGSWRASTPAARSADAGEGVIGAHRAWQNSTRGRSAVATGSLRLSWLLLGGLLRRSKAPNLGGSGLAIRPQQTRRTGPLRQPPPELPETLAPAFRSCSIRGATERRMNGSPKPVICRSMET